MVVNMLLNVHVHTCVWSVTLKCRIEAALQISTTEVPDLVSTENVYVHVWCAVIYSSLRCDAVVCGCGESW